MPSRAPHPAQVDLGSDPSEDVKAAAVVATLEALQTDSLVIVPTETVYGVAAREDRPQAVERLKALKGGRTEPYSLAVADVQQLSDRLQPLAGPAARIAKRWWPGPVTQVLPARQGPDLGVRVVGHPWTRQLLAACPSPVLLPSANHSGERAPVSFAELSAELSSEVALMVNGGRCALGECSTVVRPFVAGIQVLREGVVSREDLSRHALGFVLVVCSGNTCRSPMAALFLQRALAVQAQNFPGYLAPGVHSAGAWANRGARASDGALRVMDARGLDLGGHNSTALTRKELAGCDLVLCMTESHRRAVLELLAEPPAGPQPTVELFAPDGGEVLDPFGGPLDVYANCADQLEALATSRARQMCPFPDGSTP